LWHLAANCAENGWSLDRLSSPFSSGANLFGVCKKLEEVAGRVYSGIKPGATAAFVVSADIALDWIRENPQTSEIVRPFYRGQDLHRYSFDAPKDYIILVTNKETFMHVPQVRRHLEQNKPILERRDEVLQGGCEWFALRPCDYYEVFSERIIAWPDTTKESRFCILPPGSVIGNTAFCIRSTSLWVLPILNSSLGWRLISLICQSRDERAGLLRYRLLPQFMAKFPMVPVEEPKRKSLEAVALGERPHSTQVDRDILDLYASVGILVQDTGG
jgi:hypothetical protein